MSGMIAIGVTAKNHPPPEVGVTGSSIVANQDRAVRVAGPEGIAEGPEFLL